MGRSIICEDCGEKYYPRFDIGGQGQLPVTCRYCRTKSAGEVKCTETLEEYKARINKWRLV